MLAGPRSVPLVHLRAWLRESFWFLPLAMLLGAALLAAITLWIDWHLPTRSWRGAAVLDWVQLGGHQGTRALMVAVAGAIMTVVGVTFSVTIAVLALATSQFGPRLLRAFIRDRANQGVLGTFLATFLYCLLVALTIGSEGDPLPRLSLITAAGLTLASVLVFVFFVHHVATSIQVDHIIAAVARDADDVVSREYAPAGERQAEAVDELPAWLEDDGAPVRAERDGYVTAIDVERLIEVASQHELVLKVERRVGDFAASGTVLLLAGPRVRVDEGARGALRGCFYLADSRTTEQDLGFALDQLVEVALRAMSPSINDPFTATRCLDRLEAALSRLARRVPPPTARRDADGTLRVVVPWLELPGAITGVFAPLRAIAREPVVGRRVAGALQGLARCVPDGRALDVIRAELVALRELAPGATTLDRREVGEAVGRALAVVEERRVGAAARA